MEIGFFLKKFITFFIEPFGMVFTLFVLSLYFLLTKKDVLGKTILSLAIGILFLYSYPPFSNYLISNLENQYPKYNYKSDIEYIHILGNGHNTDISQPLSSQISDGGIKRDLEGIIIHKRVKNSTIIFTGYAGNTNIPNAIMNSKLAQLLGVDKKDMIINPNPKDTREEAIFTKSIVGTKPFVLVTSATHMPRSIMLFRSLGLNPIPAPTNFYKNEFKGYLRTPNIYSFYKSKIAIHEYIGILWVKLKQKVSN